MSGDILIIGSMNMDLIVRTETYPQNGETVVGNNFSQAPGGKGANQALAAGKLGGKVSFIGACGRDHFGEKLIANLKEGGVNTEGVYILNDNTGVASIAVEADGNNRIIIVPGANEKLTPELINKWKDKIKTAEMILLQLEIPVSTVEYIIKLASKYDTKVILDPAPVKKLSEEIYQYIDYLLPNEGELNALFKGSNLGEKDKINKLLNLGVKKILVTRGRKGVSLYSSKQQGKYSSFEVKAVDTTAAGDAFAGGFAYGLQQGWKEERAIKFANMVAAISVTKEGAQPSLPTRKEVEEFKGTKCFK